MKHTAGRILLFSLMMVALSPRVRCAEPDTSILIGDVTVAVPRYEQYRDTRRVITLDSALLLSAGDESVGELLQRQVPVVLMQYGGAGALTTLSLRGAPTAQTLVSWNGFPLNPLTSGVADLSLLDAGMFEHVALVPGAPASLYGSGTAGGALLLDNRPSWQRRLTVAGGFLGGSFGTWGGHLSLAAGNGRVQSKTRLFYRHARNDFPYRDMQRPGAPVVISAHNRYTYDGLIHNTYARLRRDWLWQGGLWLQEKHKEIPAPMGSYRTGTQTQRDSSLRLYNALTKHWSRALLSARAAWFFDNMRFTDRADADTSAYTLDARFRTSSLLGDVYYRYTTRSHFRFDGGMAATWTRARVTAYGASAGEHFVDLYGGIRYIRERWHLSGSLRQGFHSDAAAGPQGELGFRWQALPSLLTLHGTLATHYRLPTLNDRYWLPGGNPALLPEQGWSTAGGVSLTLPRTAESRWHLTWHGDGYYNVIHNQIRWIPVNGLWQPENVERVHARGMENSLNVTWSYRRMTLTALLNHHLTFSTVTEADGTEHTSRYIPKNTASATLRLDYGIFFTGIYLTATGSRYTTTDNDPLYVLDPYLLTNLVSGLHAGKKKTKYTLQLDINNLFNTAYQVMRSYAMPGRAFFLKGTVTFATP